MIQDVDALACLMCGKRDYGPNFRPLGLLPADAAAWELNRWLEGTSSAAELT
jgi:hypothetical protein